MRVNLWMTPVVERLEVRSPSVSMYRPRIALRTWLADRPADHERMWDD